jgi:hypothetical protein
MGFPQEGRALEEVNFPGTRNAQIFDEAFPFVEAVSHRDPQPATSFRERVRKLRHFALLHNLSRNEVRELGQAFDAVLSPSLQAGKGYFFAVLGLNLDPADATTRAEWRRIYTQVVETDPDVVDLYHADRERLELKSRIAEIRRVMSSPENGAGGLPRLEEDDLRRVIEKYAQQSLSLLTRGIEGLQLVCRERQLRKTGTPALQDLAFQLDETLKVARDLRSELQESGATQATSDAHSQVTALLDLRRKVDQKLGHREMTAVLDREIASITAALAQRGSAPVTLAELGYAVPNLLIDRADLLCLELEDSSSQVGVQDLGIEASRISQALAAVCDGLSEAEDVTITRLRDAIARLGIAYADRLR